MLVARHELLVRLYMIPVDEQMVTGDRKYLRFLDDIHVMIGRAARSSRACVPWSVSAGGAVSA